MSISQLLPLILALVQKCLRLRRSYSTIIYLDTTIGRRNTCACTVYISMLSTWHIVLHRSPCKRRYVNQIQRDLKRH
jgi:hypothetical protein